MWRPQVAFAPEVSREVAHENESVRLFVRLNSSASVVLSEK